tara:strand:- start:638 stop:832 length:195 start_codon:yes stop_codon:yes gene_type:complete
MKAETVIEHIKVWLKKPSVSQITIHKQPKTSEVMLEIKQQYRDENVIEISHKYENDIEIPKSNR